MEPPPAPEISEPVSGEAPAPANGRRVLPTLAVLAVLCVVVLGGYVAAWALSQPVGPPVTVAGVARVSPLSGWELATRLADPPGARLTRGSGNLDVIATPFTGDPAALARLYVARALKPDAQRLKVSPSYEPVHLASGLSGVRIAYVGLFRGVQSPIEGQVTVVVSRSAAGVVFDGWAPQGLLQYSLNDIDTMIDSAEIR